MVYHSTLAGWLPLGAAATAGLAYDRPSALSQKGSSAIKIAQSSDKHPGEFDGPALAVLFEGS